MLVVWYCMLYMYVWSVMKCVFVHLFCDVVACGTLWCVMCTINLYFWTQGTYLQVHVVCGAPAGPPMTEQRFSLPTGEAQQQKSTPGGMVLYMLN